MNFLKKNYKLVVFLILTAFAIVSILNAKNDSATFDEVAHIPAGYSYLTKHDTRLNPEHPPLLKDLAAFPLLFQNLNFDTNSDFWNGNYPRLYDDGQWYAGRYFLYEAGNSPDRILFWSRLPIILLSVILGLFLFLWGKEIAGIFGGLLVLTLYAADPNVLGHNHFVTTDIGIAAFITFAFYFFLKFIKDSSWKNATYFGIFFGLMNLAKFSSVITFPILGIVFLIYPFFKKISHDENEDRDKKIRRKLFWDYFLKGIYAVTLSFVLIWIFYFFNTYDMPQRVIDEQIGFSFPTSDSNIKSVYTHKILSVLNSNEVTRPFAEYFLGIAMVFKRVAGGNGAYFLGDVITKGSWLYFPFVFATKETIPFLGLILFATVYSISQIIIAIRKKVPGAFRKFMQVKVMQYTLLSFILLYSILSITGNLTIGFRHLFPIIPLVYLLVAKKVVSLFRKKHTLTKKQLQIILAIVVVWIVIEPIISYPSYTSYFNESIGGSKNGYEYVTDSNTDWGQDLKRLKNYVDRHPEIDKIRVDYFGGGNPEYYLGNKYVSWWDSRRPVELGWYAISANSLQSSIYDKNKAWNENYHWTNQYTPIDMIGKSILIYHVTVPPFND